MDLKFDIEGHLKIRFPILFELLDKNKIDWKKVESTFRNKYFEYVERLSRTKTTFPIQASFYNIIISAIKGEQPAQRMLDYIQKVFEELTDRLDENEKKEIRDVIFGFLTNMDLKYLNFLGELSVLNLYKKNMGYKLLKTEVPVFQSNKNGVKVDFQFLDEESGATKLLEVVNIHLNEKHIISEDSIHNLLSQKIGAKLSVTHIEKGSSIFLIPVLWGQWDEIKPVIDFYEKQKPDFHNTVTPVCFMTFTDSSGNMLHKFGSINSILDGVVLKTKNHS